VAYIIHGITGACGYIIAAVLD